jgi:GxxExxY protein
MELSKEELPHVIIGACMEVHKHLGPALHVEAYKECLAFELRMREIIFQRDVPLSFSYKSHSVHCSTTLDFVVEDLMILKVEAIDELLPMHKQTLNSYLRLTQFESGFLINFSVAKLREGIKRLIVSQEEPGVPYK